MTIRAEIARERAEQQSAGLRLSRRELWLLAGLLSTVIALDQLVHHSSWGVLVGRIHAANQMQLYAHRLRAEPEDVLIVGSSRARAAVDPHLITQYLGFHPEHEYEAVRVVLNGMRATLLHHFVRDQLRARPPAELLVIGLEARYFYVPPLEADEPLGYRLLGSSRDLLELNPFEMALSQLKAASMGPLRGLQAPWNLHRILTPDAAAYVEYLHETRGLPLVNYETLSAAELSHARAQRDAIAERDASYDEVDLRESEISAFERTLDMLEELPCEVAFARMPVLPEFDQEQHRQLRAFQERVVAPLQARGFEYYDLNEHAELREEALFKDPSHVDVEGMRMVSDLLARNVVCHEVYDLDQHPELIPVMRAEAQRQAREEQQQD